MAEGERRLAAIMFTDIVGYTALTQHDEKQALRLLEAQWRLIRPVVSRHGGREIKTIGDGSLVEFDSALDASECAGEIQKVLGDHNRDASDKILVRIGVHVGDVVHKGKDVYGDAVNIASRIMPLAENGGAVISEQVYAQVRNKIPYRLEKMPAHRLKNVQYPVEVYRLGLPLESEAELSAPKNRIAVLPLSNISPDPKDGYFADGLTEELITVLSQVRGLRVIARTSVDRYKSHDQGIAQISRDLGVGSVIEGSVRIAGDRLRVTVQLVDASNEEHLWSENYDRKLDDIFAVQSDIAKQVAENLEVKLLVGDQDRIGRRSVDNIAAYKDYLRGRALLAGRKTAEMKQAKELFEKSVKEYPSYAPAFVGLADAYYLLGDYGAMPSDESRQKSREYVTKALKLDPDLAEAHASLGLNLYADYRFAEAAPEYKRALELNPSYGMAHMWYGHCLGAMRRYEEQLEHLRIAEQLDPLSAVVVWNEGILLGLLGRKEEAWEKSERLSKLDPGSPRALTFRSFCYDVVDGNPKVALEELGKHPELHGEMPVMMSLAIESASAGDKEAAHIWLDKILASPSPEPFKISSVPFIYLTLGDYDQFFAWANKAVDKKSMEFVDIELFPDLKPLLSDPRWKALLKRANLDKT